MLEIYIYTIKVEDDARNLYIQAHRRRPAAVQVGNGCAIYPFYGVACHATFT